MNTLKKKNFPFNKIQKKDRIGRIAVNIIERNQLREFNFNDLSDKSTDKLSCR
jgi:hypothetical protein